jgi:hypothetical protein
MKVTEVTIERGKKRVRERVRERVRQREMKGAEVTIGRV